MAVAEAAQQAFFLLKMFLLGGLVDIQQHGFMQRVFDLV